MAPSATDSPQPPQVAELDNVGKPPSDIVIPPSSIKAVLEKTAGYVVRNKEPFELRMKNLNSDNPKFSFLNPNDAYHAYYVWRKSEIKVGRDTTVSQGNLGEAQTAIPKKPQGPDPPPEFHFSARMPAMNAKDLDVVKLTALFVAKNGRSFVTQLSQKEASNYQFDFLRPQHSLYQYFTRLVDQYTELLNAKGSDGAKQEEARIAELTKNVNNKLHILDRARKRAQWVEFQEQQKQKKEEEAEEEKVAYASIDWHDFVIVETVMFNEVDDKAELPPPTSLSDLQSASLEQKAMMSLQPHHRRIEEAMPTDDLDDLPVQKPQVNLPPPPSLPARPAPSPVATEPQPSQETATQTAARGTAAQKPMNIRSDYVPRAQAQRGRNQQMAVCPNCKQQIPYDELSEHMRIELLDPQWKLQREQTDRRNATSNLSTADVANNLKRLASQRTDVFDGATGEPISEEEAARRKRAATNYDGVILGDGNHRDPTSATAQAKMSQMHSMNINEQLRHIHEKAAGK